MKKEVKDIVLELKIEMRAKIKDYLEKGILNVKTKSDDVYIHVYVNGKLCSLIDKRLDSSEKRKMIHTIYNTIECFVA